MSYLSAGRENTDYKRAMSQPNHICLIALVFLSACGPKTGTEQETRKTDSVPVTRQKPGFLDLDVGQYEVYESGSPSVTLPESDLFGVPKDREPTNLQQVTGITRTGDELTFQLKNDQQKVLKNNFTDADNTAEYIFMRNLDAIGYWEVLAFYYESFDYILINQTDGTETHLWNKAVLSPDNKYILCGTVDIEAGFVPNGFQLWYVDDGKLVLQWEKELNDWGAEKLVWTKDTEVWGEQTYRENVSGELKKRLVKMRMFWKSGE